MSIIIPGIMSTKPQEHIMQRSILYIAKYGNHRGDISSPLPYSIGYGQVTRSRSHLEGEDYIRP